MDITAEDRADLASALEGNIGRREAQTLMAHLPEGGAANLATKDDLAALSEDLRAQIARCATKDDLQGFTTKDDLQRFATKDDLQRFATKDDLQRFATKDDLQRFATKDDLQRFLTREEFGEFRSTTFADFRAATHEQFREVKADLGELKGEVHQLRNEATEAIAMGNKLRAEWRHDLVTYIGRQTIIQLASLLAIVIAAFTYAAAVTP